MTIHRKSQDMLLLETAFASLKQKQDMERSMQTISRVISRRFDLNFTINLIQNKQNTFFGMSIIPAHSLMDTFLARIINEKAPQDTLNELWAQNKDWTLEVDSILLYDTNLNANPAEMVAILLHEIGHVVFSNTVPQRINKVMRLELMKLSYTAKKIVRWKRAQHLFDFVFVEACGSKNFHLTHELEADKFVVKMGYGQNLSEFVQKLLTTQGNALINRSEKAMEKDVQAIVQWSVDNLTELEFRTTKLRAMLQTELLRSSSLVVRDIAARIKKSFFGSNEKNTFDTIVQEQYLLQEYKRVKELEPTKEGFFGLFDSKTKKLKKLTQSDIDVITIEMARIVNQDDKIYVLDLIYENLDIVLTGLEMYTRKDNDRVPVSKDTLLRYKKELEELRKQVLAVKIKEPQYGVFVKYPKGYEG